MVMEKSWKLKSAGTPGATIYSLVTENYPSGHLSNLRSLVEVDGFDLERRGGVGGGDGDVRGIPWSGIPRYIVK